MAVTTEEGGLPAKGGGRRRKLRWALAAALVAVAAGRQSFQCLLKHDSCFVYSAFPPVAIRNL
jgi:hypothetical protein